MSTPHGNDAVWPSRLAFLLGQNRTPITLGQSEASVWRIEGDETLFLKRAPIHALSELPGEASRLAWLAGKPVPAPRLRASFAADGFDWLLMTALPGRDLTHFVDRPTELCHILAAGLRSVHAQDPADCPFDHRLEARLASGAANVAAGRVDETDFDATREGWTAEAVLAWLHENRPASEDLVVTHGDASLPNIMADHAAFAGIIDCGRLGVADRWQDLALACWSIAFNCGEAHIPTFLATYGATWDAARYAYYCTLDELF